jgi:hypothetical protein
MAEVGSLAWASDQAGLARSSPATRAGLGPARKKNSSKIFSKICDFPQIFYCILINIGFVFLYCKDTNLVLKYPIFVKTLKKRFVFMHTTKSLKNKRKKIRLYFHTTKKISKIYISMHFGFNKQFIKIMRTRPIFQKFQKNYFVFF